MKAFCWYLKSVKGTNHLAQFKPGIYYQNEIRIKMKSDTRNSIEEYNGYLGECYYYAIGLEEKEL